MAVLLNNFDGVIEIQDGGVGRGNRGVLDVVQDVKTAMGGFNKSLGGITRDYRISPRTNRYVPRPVRREAPEAIAPELTCKMVAANYLERFGADDRFALYVRHTTRRPQDPLSYVRVDILSDVAVESFNYGDFTVDEGAQEDITLTVPLNAAAHVRVLPVEGKKLATAWSGAKSCAVTAAVVDEDGAIYAVTAAAATEAGKPYLVTSPDDGATWTEKELTDLSSGCTALAIAGERLVVAAGTTLAVYDKAGTLQSTSTAAGAVAALAAIDAATLVAVGADGLVQRSEDGAASWRQLVSGVSVALGCLAFRHVADWYAGGASGTLLHVANGVVSTIPLPSALSTATVTSIALPDAPAGFSRETDVYVGTSSGLVYRYDGETWTAVRFPGDGAGSVTALAFVEFLGQVLYVLHAQAGGTSLLYRDFSGGAGGNPNVERIPLPTNSGLAALVAVDANNALLLGSVHAGAELVVKVES
ncbi:WD40/YVTN/BNR-like repeat-containing protein [Aggregatilinea lenta]|uniref:WD40/YVTN/BNR-like repeat-containing protein n=1 Tax=Aggregatilinea lenta TaxID=913108 RepID=UPI000E5C1943|nr:hypothetical protein [Aggregatilinea lenta]